MCPSAFAFARASQEGGPRSLKKSGWVQMLYPLHQVECNMLVVFKGVLLGTYCRRVSGGNAQKLPPFAPHSCKAPGSESDEGQGSSSGLFVSHLYI